MPDDERLFDPESLERTQTVSTPSGVSRPVGDPPHDPAGDPVTSVAAVPGEVTSALPPPPPPAPDPPV